MASQSFLMWLAQRETFRFLLANDMNEKRNKVGPQLLGVWLTKYMLLQHARRIIIQFKCIHQKHMLQVILCTFNWLNYQVYRVEVGLLLRYSLSTEWHTSTDCQLSRIIQLYSALPSQCSFLNWNIPLVLISIPQSTNGSQLITGDFTICHKNLQTNLKSTKYCSFLTLTKTLVHKPDSLACYLINLVLITLLLIRCARVLLLPCCSSNCY